MKSNPSYLNELIKVCDVETQEDLLNLTFYAQMNEVTKIHIPSVGNISVKDGNKLVWIEAHLDEYRYKLSEGYKISLEGVHDESYYQHYYISDFISLIESGQIIINDGGKSIKHKLWKEPITSDGKVYVEHEAYFVE